ncbi:ribosomal protein L33 [Candidatus Hodgkinia cicadicola]|nr:ribosomal protein L33 [Candidatus Hodgkinia cicadicola]
MVTTKKPTKKRKTYKKVKLVSELKTGRFYIVKKPTKTQKKLNKTKYDPKARKHCVFKETKIN